MAINIVIRLFFYCHIVAMDLSNSATMTQVNRHIFEVVFGAFGGLEAVRWGVTFWVNHKTNTRKEDASADSMEDENKRKQVDWLEERIAQRDAKIDALYVKLRNEQSDKLAWIHKCHELELQLKDAEHNRCDRPDSECGRRIPPRRTTLIKDKEEKKNG